MSGMAFCLTHQEYSINYCWMREKKSVKQFIDIKRKLYLMIFIQLFNPINSKKLLVSDINNRLRGVHSLSTENLGLLKGVS